MENDASVGHGWGWSGKHSQGNDLESGTPTNFNYLYLISNVLSVCRVVYVWRPGNRFKTYSCVYFPSFRGWEHEKVLKWKREWFKAPQGIGETMGQSVAS